MYFNTVYSYYALLANNIYNTCINIHIIYSFIFLFICSLCCSLIKRNKFIHLQCQF